MRGLVLALLLAASPARAEVQVDLVTVGQGDDVSAVAGHVALRVHDLATGRDVAYNWGLYDFERPGFLLDYVKGNLLYSVGQIPTDRMVAAYLQSEPERSITFDRLRLTPAETSRLVARADWWLRPEHRDYQYDMWRRNCATLLRDVLDEALDGRLRRALAAPTGHTVRGVGRRYFAAKPALGFVVDLILGRLVDQPLTAWDELFQPLRVREALAASSLVAATTVVHQGTFVPSAPRDVALWVGLLAALALAVTALIPRFRAPVRIVGAAAAGALGSLMLFLWVCTQHVGAHANANLALFWPTDLLFVRRLPAGKAYAVLHVAAALALVALRGAGVVEQEVASLWLILPWIGFWLLAGADLRSPASRRRPAESLPSPTLPPG